MKLISAILLQAITICIGLGVLAFMLWEPHLEGRNVNATIFEIYFKDPFLAYVYVSSIAFFVGLYQIYKVLGYIRQHQTFSQPTLKAVRTIKYCALLSAALVFGAEAYIWTAMHGKDDIAGGVAIGLFLIFVSVITVIGTTVFEGILREGMSSESKTPSTTQR